MDSISNKVITRAEEFLSFINIGTKPSQLNTIIIVCEQFLSQTEKLYKYNSAQWPYEKLNDYTKRIHFYREIIITLGMLKRNPKSFVELSAFESFEYSKDLYRSVEKEFMNEYKTSNENRRNEIIEEILAPHLVIVKFIKDVMSGNLGNLIFGK